MRLPIRIPRSSTPLLQPLLQPRTYATETLTIPSTVLSPPPAGDAPAKANTAPYRVNRTSTNRLPVYHRIRGGNRTKTMIQHVEGNSLRLKEDVMELLQLGKKDVVVNPSNGHVVVRGAYKDQVVDWLKERGF